MWPKILLSSLLLLSWAPGQMEARTFERCQLARAFLHKYHFPRDQIDDWVCIARWESHYNSSAVGTLNWDGSRDHGLFQISELWWCEGDGEEKGKGCQANCQDFLDDDIDDDVSCVKKIFKEHEGLSGNGFNAWVAWKSRCQGDLSRFLEGCRLDGPGGGEPEKDRRPEVAPNVEEDKEEEGGFAPGIVAPAPAPAPAPGAGDKAGVSRPMMSSPVAFPSDNLFLLLKPWFA